MIVTADDEPAGGERPKQEYISLPPEVRLDETIASVEPEPVPDPDAVRNVDQHGALRDD